MKAWVSDVRARKRDGSQEAKDAFSPLAHSLAEASAVKPLEIDSIRLTLHRVLHFFREEPKLSLHEDAVHEFGDAVSTIIKSLLKLGGLGHFYPQQLHTTEFEVVSEGEEAGVGWLVLQACSCVVQTDAVVDTLSQTNITKQLVKVLKATFAGARSEADFAVMALLCSMMQNLVKSLAVVERLNAEGTWQFLLQECLAGSLPLSWLQSAQGVLSELSTNWFGNPNVVSHCAGLHAIKPLLDAALSQITTADSTQPQADQLHAALTLVQIAQSWILRSAGTSTTMLKEFENAPGNQIIVKILLAIPEQLVGKLPVVDTFRSLLDMCFIGPGPVQAPLPDPALLPFPLPSAPGPKRMFSMTVPGQKDQGVSLNTQKICSLCCFEVFHDVFLTSRLRTMRRLALESMQKLFKLHEHNYVAVRTLKTFARFLDSKEDIDGALVPLISDVLLLVVLQSRGLWVPFEELCVLTTLMHHDSFGENRKASVLFSVISICSSDRRYQTVLREAGMLHLLLDALDKYTESLDSYFDRRGLMLYPRSISKERIVLDRQTSNTSVSSPRSNNNEDPDSSNDHLVISVVDLSMSREDSPSHMMSVLESEYSLSWSTCESPSRGPTKLKVDDPNQLALDVSSIYSDGTHDVSSPPSVLSKRGIRVPETVRSVLTQVDSPEELVRLGFEALDRMIADNETNQKLVFEGTGSVFLMNLVCIDFMSERALALVETCLRFASNVRGRNKQRLRPVLDNLIGGLLELLQMSLKGSVSPTHSDVKNQGNFKLVLSILRSMRQLFGVSQDVQDVFRDLNGLFVLLSLLIGIKVPPSTSQGFNHDPSDQQSLQLLVLLQDILLTVTAALAFNPQSRQQWNKDIGFKRIVDALRFSGIIGQSPRKQELAVLWLLNIALEYVPPQVIRRQHEHRPRNLSLSMTGAISNPVLDGPIMDLDPFDNEPQAVGAELKSETTPEQKESYDTMHFVDPLLSVDLARLPLPPSSNDTPSIIHNVDALQHSLICLGGCRQEFQLKVIDYLHSLSCHAISNESALGQAGISRQFANYVLADGESVATDDEVGRAYLRLVCAVLPFITAASDMQHLHCVLHSPWMTQTITSLAASMSIPNWPFLMLDMQANGFAHVDVRLGHVKTWPPSNGYSIMFWVYFERFPSATPLRLLRIQSNDNRSFTDIYLQSSMLVLQTSPKRPMMFNHHHFKAGQWYHVALTHSRGRLSMAGSTASLHVNGNPIQSGKISYIASASSQAGLSATIGTPPMFETEKFSGSCFRLASMSFMDECYDWHVIQNLYRAGPKLTGLTNGGSRLPTCDIAERFLNMAIESANTMAVPPPSAQLPVVGKSTLPPPALASCFASHSISPIITSILPPDKVIFHVHALNAGVVVESDTPESTRIEVQPIQVADTGERLALLPSGHAAEHVARTEGCRLYCPQRLADSMLQIGGIQRVMQLLSSVKSEESLNQVLSYFRMNLCGSAETHRDVTLIDGYAVIMSLISPEHINRSVIETMLNICGLFDECMSGSVQNPEAFEAFFVNYSFWECVDSELQACLFQSLTNAIVISPNRMDNIDRFRKAGLIQYLLTIISFTSFPHDLLASVISIVRICVETEFNPGDIRLIVEISCNSAVTASSKSSAPALQRASTAPEVSRGARRNSQPDTHLLPRTELFKTIENTQAALEVKNSLVQMVYDVLVSVINHLSNQHKSDQHKKFTMKHFNTLVDIADFAWLFTLLRGQRHEGNDTAISTAVLALKILITIVQFSSAHLSKLRSLRLDVLGLDADPAECSSPSNSSGTLGDQDTGFAILSQLLVPYCGCFEVYYLLFCLLLKQPVQDIPPAPASADAMVDDFMIMAKVQVQPSGDIADFMNFFPPPTFSRNMSALHYGALRCCYIEQKRRSRSFGDSVDEAVTGNQFAVKATNVVVPEALVAICTLLQHSMELFVHWERGSGSCGVVKHPLTTHMRTEKWPLYLKNPSSSTPTSRHSNPSAPRPPNIDLFNGATMLLYDMFIHLEDFRRHWIKDCWTELSRAMSHLILTSSMLRHGVVPVPDPKPDDLKPALVPFDAHCTGMLIDFAVRSCLYAMLTHSKGAQFVVDLLSHSPLSLGMEESRLSPFVLKKSPMSPPASAEKQEVNGSHKQMPNLVVPENPLITASPLASTTEEKAARSPSFTPKPPSTPPPARLRTPSSVSSKASEHSAGREEPFGDGVMVEPPWERLPQSVVCRMVSRVMTRMIHLCEANVTAQFLVQQHVFSRNFTKFCEVTMELISTDLLTNIEMQVLRMVMRILEQPDLQKKSDSLFKKLSRTNTKSDAISKSLLSVANQLVIHRLCGSDPWRDWKKFKSFSAFLIDYQHVLFGELNEDQPFFANLLHHLRRHLRYAMHAPYREISPPRPSQPLPKSHLQVARQAALDKVEPETKQTVVKISCASDESSQSEIKSDKLTPSPKKHTPRPPRTPPPASLKHSSTTGHMSDLSPHGIPRSGTIASLESKTESRRIIQESVLRVLAVLLKTKLDIMSSFLTAISKKDKSIVTFNLLDHGFAMLLGSEQDGDWQEFCKWFSENDNLIEQVFSGAYMKHDPAFVSIMRLVATSRIAMKEQKDALWNSFSAKWAANFTEAEDMSESTIEVYRRLSLRLIRRSMACQQDHTLRMLDQRQTMLDKMQMFKSKWTGSNSELSHVDALLVSETPPASTSLIAPHSVLKAMQGKALHQQWKLDVVEGPCRVRRRLVRPVNAKSQAILSALPTVQTPHDDDNHSDSEALSSELLTVPAPEGLLSTRSAPDLDHPSSGTDRVFSYVNVSEQPPALLRACSDQSGFRSPHTRRSAPRSHSERTLVEAKHHLMTEKRRMSHVPDASPVEAKETPEIPRTPVKQVRSPMAALEQQQIQDEDKQDPDTDAFDATHSPSESTTRRTSMLLPTEDGLQTNYNWLVGMERLKMQLHEGDDIHFHFNCLRVVGPEEVTCVLLLCSSHMYLVDLYHIAEDGTIEEVHEDQPDFTAQPSVADSHLTRSDSTGTVLLNVQQSQNVVAGQFIPHECRTWSYLDVVECHKRRYLLRDSGLEFFFTDNTTILVVFNEEQRDKEVLKRLERMCPLVKQQVSLHAGFGSTGSAISAAKALLKTSQQQWQLGQLSNFEYLMRLNSLAGRSFNDLTQYPVFPWVLAQYTGDSVDLNDPMSYRDLSKPMGALSPSRAEEFRRRYADSVIPGWDDTELNAPFHYGTHYSSAAVVLYYLLRLEPFTQYLIHLQGGRFDRADRLFQDLPQTWLTASKVSTSDVKELIPEFFYLGEMFENGNKLAFGENQSGHTIDNVRLPPWAKGNPRLFIHKQKQALESPFVSAHLHQWIDLIFGYKQQGPEAVEALNVFQYITYPNNVNLDMLTDPLRHEATIEQIRHFGQTPLQLFTKPHPPRRRLAHTGDLFSPSLTQMVELLEIRSFSHAVGSIECPMADPNSNIPANASSFALGNGLFVVEPQHLIQPIAVKHGLGASASKDIKFIAWGYVDGSLRTGVMPSKVKMVYRNMHSGVVKAVALSPDSTRVITGGDDCLVKVWKKFTKKGLSLARDALKGELLGKGKLLFVQTLQGHRGPINCLAMSKPFSIIVSGSQDQSIIVWDLNTLVCLRRFAVFSGPVCHIAINQATGDIAACSRTSLYFWDVNGRLLASVSDLMTLGSHITSLTIAHTQGHEAADSCGLLATGHQDSSVRIWSVSLKPQGSDPSDDNTDPARWTFTCLRKLTGGHQSPISAVGFSPDHNYLWSGDRMGHAVKWGVAERSSYAENPYPHPDSTISLVVQRTKERLDEIAGENKDNEDALRGIAGRLAARPNDSAARVAQLRYPRLPPESCVCASRSGFLGIGQSNADTSRYWCPVQGCGDLLCAECLLTHIRGKHSPEQSDARLDDIKESDAQVSDEITDGGAEPAAATEVKEPMEDGSNSSDAQTPKKAAAAKEATTTVSDADAGVGDRSPTTTAPALTPVKASEPGDVTPSTAVTPHRSPKKPGEEQDEETPESKEDAAP